MDVKKYVLPNKIDYLEYVHNTYHPHKIQTLTDDTTFNKKRQRMHQMFVNRYMDTKTPYRGLLLYHELGTGKTMTAIGVIDKYIGTDRNIFVLLPASLRNNFIKELLIHSKFRRYKRTVKWSYVDVTETSLKNDGYHFYIKYKDGYWVPDYSKDTKGKTYKELSDESKSTIDKLIVSIIQSFVTFIHYNGLTKEILNKFKGKINHDKLKEWLMKSALWSCIDGSKGIKKQYGYQPPLSKKTAWVPQYRDDVDGIKVLKQLYYKDMDEVARKHVDKTIAVIMENAVNFVDMIKVPDLKVFDNAFSNSIVVIDEAHKFIRMVSNERDTGTVMYNYLMDAMNCRILLLSGTPIINKPFEVANLLNLVRGKTKIYSSKKKTVDFDDKYSRYIDTIDNFKNQINITLLPRNFVKDDDGKIRYQKWDLHDDTIINRFMNAKVKINEVVTLPTKEEEFEELFLSKSVDKNGEEMVSLRNTDMFMRRIQGLISFFDRYGDNYPELYPVVYKELEMSDHQFNIYMERKKFEIELEAKKKKKKNVFDENKGIFKAFTRMMCNFVFPSSIKRQFPHDMMQDGGEDTYTKVLENSMEKFRKIKHTNEDLQMFSPKYTEIIKDIQDTSGKVLVYSQFRTVEGVGMFKVYLGKYGYTEFTDDNVTADNIGKRFMILNLDKDKAQKQIELFNNKKNNLHGENVKILIITESGSEGISLKHTRLVCILEPYWNMILMKQVIGRAVRDGSHLDLPENERNVRAYIYIMKGTEYQSKNNPTFRIKSNGLTTDQEILEIAQKKQVVIDEVMELMRHSAVDCSIHAKTNKPDKGCYQWAINIDKNLDAYKPSYSDESRNMHHKQYELTKMIRGTAVMINGFKYVQYEDQLYDYNVYVYAKKLIPAEILETTYNVTTAYDIKDVLGDGACFYRALYVSLKHINMIDAYSRCVGLVNVTSENSFVTAMKDKLLKDMINSEYIENIYNELKDIDIDTYNIIIDKWDTNIHKKLKTLPKSIDEFKTILQEEISKTTCYASEIEISYLKSICDKVINIVILNSDIKPSQTFNQKNVYLRNLEERHYNAILPRYT